VAANLADANLIRRNLVSDGFSVTFFAIFSKNAIVGFGSGLFKALDEVHKGDSF
jgi:hypothetical protein